MSQNFDSFSFKLDQTSLIEASAGTGKTYSIVNMFIRLLLNLGSSTLKAPVPAKNILLITFTNNSADELKERVLKRMYEMQVRLQALITYLAEYKPADYLEQIAHDSALVEALVLEFLKHVTKKDSYDEFEKNCLVQICQEQRLASCLEILQTEYKNNEFCIQTIDSFIVQTAIKLKPELSGQNVTASAPSSQSKKRTFTLLRQSLAKVLEQELKQLSTKYANQQQAQAILNQIFAPQQFSELVSNTIQTKFSVGKVSADESYLLGTSEAKDNNLLTFIRDKIYGTISPFEIEKLFTQYFTHADFQGIELAQVNLEAILNAYLKNKAHLEAQDNAEDAPDFASLNLEFFNRVRVYLIKKILDQYLDFSLRQQELDLATYGIMLERSIKENPELISKQVQSLYRFVFIDEFQDTNPLQFDIIQSIFAPTQQTQTGQNSQSTIAQATNTIDQVTDQATDIAQNAANNYLERGLIMIGDPKQAIYAFRGADIYNYFTAKTYAVQAPPMTKNYRSSAPYLEACNLLFTANNRFFTLPQISYQPIQAGNQNNKVLLFKNTQDLLEIASPITFIGIEEQQDEQDKASKKKTKSNYDSQYAIAHFINHLVVLGREGRLFIGEPSLAGTKHLQQAKAVTENDICVLVRTNEQIKTISNYLRTYFGIESKITDDSIEVDDSLFKQLIVALEAISKPQEQIALKNYLYTALSGKSFSQVQQIIKDSELYSAVKTQLQNYQFLWQQQNLSAAISALIRDNLLPNAGKYRYSFIENFWQLTHLLVETLESPQNLERVIQQINDEHFCKSFIDNYKQALNKSNKDHTLVQNMQQEANEHKVTLMTMHASKGLEFPVVICYQKSAATFDSKLFKLQDYMPNFSGFYDFNNILHGLFNFHDEQSSDARLFYVAGTRAKTAMFYLYDQQIFRDFATGKSPSSIKTKANQEIYATQLNAYLHSHTPEPQALSIAQSEQPFTSYLASAFEKYLANHQHSLPNNYMIDFYSQHFASSEQELLKLRYDIYIQRYKFVELIPSSIFNKMLEQTQDGFSNADQIALSEGASPESKIVWQCFYVLPDYALGDLLSDTAFSKSNTQTSTVRQQRNEYKHEEQKQLAQDKLAVQAQASSTWQAKDLTLLGQSFTTFAQDNVKFEPLVDLQGQSLIAPQAKAYTFNALAQHLPLMSFTRLNKQYLELLQRDNSLKGNQVQIKIESQSDYQNTRKAHNLAQTSANLQLQTSQAENTIDYLVAQPLNGLDADELENPALLTQDADLSLNALNFLANEQANDQTKPQGSQELLNTQEIQASVGSAEQVEAVSEDNPQEASAPLSNNLHVDTTKTLPFITDPYQFSKVLRNNLPHGAEFGTKVHKFFEEYNPQTPENNQQLLEMLFPTRFAEERNTNQAIHNFIQATLDYPLCNLQDFNTQAPNRTIRISDADLGRLNEWEFFFNPPEDELAQSEYKQLVRRLATYLKQEGLIDLNSPEEFTLETGQFTGFIDLILFANQEIFILDYKTNDLGSNLSDYTAEKLTEKMKAQGYILQMYIYLAAVYTYCEQELFDEYPEQLAQIKFIGMHLFMRGMLYLNPEDNKTYGVYTQQPSHQVLQNLSRIIRGLELI
ncbi:UvrD-helicase domain-containing protein [Psittacicella hinzii]|nr:UvrD-helicase domain-containing protein [Psittacicella hinzii]